MAENVIIATDADAEGDVIAWDVATLIRDMHPNPLRVRMKGLDDDSVRASIDAATPVRKADAVAGRTRAIVDRLIGASFSRPDVGVGRVQTALLGLVQRDKPSTLRLNLVAPAKDGGRVFMAEAPCVAPFDPEIARRLTGMALPMISAGATSTVASPAPHMGDIMVRAAEKLDMSPRETDDSMQRLYEQGRPQGYLNQPVGAARGMSVHESQSLLMEMQACRSRQFLAHNIHLTQARTGVLIFVSLAERYAEIVADSGIDDRVDQSVWDSAVRGLTQSAADGRLVDGFIQAIGTVVSVLAEHFPVSPGDTDELENRLVEI